MTYDMTADVLLRLFIAACAGVIAFHCICAANKMTRSTSHPVRAAVIVAAAGAFGEVAHALCWTSMVSMHEALFVAGFLGLLIVNRRRNRCPCVVVTGNQQACSIHVRGAQNDRTAPI